MSSFCFQLNNFLQLIPLDILGASTREGSSFGTSLFLGKGLNFVLKRGEHYWDQRRTRLDGTVRGQTVEERPDFTLGLQVALSSALFRDLDAELHTLDELLGRLFRLGILEAFILLFPSLSNLNPFWNVKGVRPEESIDLRFQFWYILLIKCRLEHFSTEHHHRFIEISVSLLISENFRFELHVTVSMVVFFIADRFVSKYNPAVLVSHLFCLLIEFLLLRG